jgi:hypothetical protein
MNKTIFTQQLLRLTCMGLATLALTACSGDGGDADTVIDPTAAPDLNNDAPTPPVTDNTSNNRKTIAVSGKLMNMGYLGNTQVCADLDDDGVCGSGEPTTISDASGNYALVVPTGYRGGRLLALVRPTSTDSASTDADPITVQQGWTLPTLLEYEDDVSSVNINISPITATYYARMRVSGRNRLSNQIAMFTRIVYETNIDPTTGQLILPMDFDYVATPKNTLAARLKSMHDVLSSRAQTNAAPLDTTLSTAMFASWYSTYTGPTASLAAIPVDATRIATFVDTSNNSVAAFLAQDYRYFHTRTDAGLRLRAGLTETAGWLRALGTGNFDSFDRRLTTLANGALVQKAMRWSDDLWTELTVDEGGYYTLDTQGALIVNNGTEYLQPRVITFADGNRVTFRMPGNSAQLAFEVADSLGTNFYIEEWVGEQRSYETYYNGVEPAIAPLTAKPACVMNYPGTPQTNNDNRINSTSITDWYRVCFDYYTAQYYDLVKSDLQLQYVDSAVPGANFYDATLKQSVLVAPLTQFCGTTEHPQAKVRVLDQEHCNWAVNANGGHVLENLFAVDGVTINSWSKTYGSTDFTDDDITTTRVAGSAEQTGLPQQLTLKLVRNGNETSGSGTLTSPFGAWTANSYSETTEAIHWEISVENPAMVLISWPFRDVNDPRVPSNTASNGAAAISAPVLPGGHFTASWNGNNFSAAPTTHTSPNYRKLAIVLQDGVFVTGQYYGKGYTYNERYFTTPAMIEGMAAMNYVFGKLYAAGFIDQ